MDTEKGWNVKSVSFSLITAHTFIFVCLCLLLSACAGNTTPLPTPSFSPTIPPYIPTDTLISTPPIISSPTPICVSRLIFARDVTIPDFSIVAAGSLLDKQWLVQNSGSCNWDNLYRIRLVSGDGLGASPEQALYPARAGMQATLRILFTAPMVQGEYYSEWQAFDSQGIPFGDTFFIKIIVQ